MAIEPGVEAPSFSWRALAAERPFEDGGSSARDQRAGQHADAEIVPHCISPDERCGCTSEPQRAVATVSEDECEQTRKARLAGKGKAR